MQCEYLIPNNFRPATNISQSGYQTCYTSTTFGNSMFNQNARIIYGE